MIEEAEMERVRIETEAIQKQAEGTSRKFLGIMFRRNAEKATHSFCISWRDVNPNPNPNLRKLNKAYMSWRDVNRAHDRQYKVLMRAAMHIHMLEVVRLYVRSFALNPEP